MAEPLSTTRSRAVRTVPRASPGIRGAPPSERVELPAPPAEGFTLRFTDRPRAKLPRVGLKPGHLTLLEATVSVEPVRHRLVIDCATRGRPLVQIVAGNRLDSPGLARRAQAQGLDPGYVLRASVLARAFTAYQLSVLVEERLPAQLADEEAAGLAVVSDPLSLYTDEDVRPVEGRRLAEQAFASLQATAKEHACPLLVTQRLRADGLPAGGRPAPGRRERPRSADRALVERMREHAEMHLRLRGARAGSAEGGPGRVLERPRRGETVRWADPRPEQAKLDRFLGSADREGHHAGDREVPEARKRARVEVHHG